MSTSFVSIVTPVYNDDPYLEECIRSVLSQTHEDFEYIVCDNHSCDRSGEIARDFAVSDRRMRVVSPPEFLPQARNFNYALQQVSQRAHYCKMLSSDDWLFPECVERMVALAELHPTVGLVSSYRLIEASPDCFGVPVERSVFPGREAARWQILGLAYPFGTPSTVLYRAARVREALPVFFPEDRFYFDLDAALRIMKAHDFGFVHQVLSFSRYQPGAIMDQANQLHTWPLMHYITADQHGRAFLTPDEFARHSVKVRNDLYGRLGEVWLKDRLRRHKRDDIWAFQRTHLASIGAALKRDEILKGAVRAGLRFLGCPRHLLGSLRRA